MINDMIQIIKSNKLNISIAGGVLVIATAYGTCTVDPNEDAIKEAVEEKIEEKKASEEPVEEKVEEKPSAESSEVPEQPKVKEENQEEVE